MADVPLDREFCRKSSHWSDVVNCDRSVRGLEMGRQTQTKLHHLLFINVRTSSKNPKGTQFCSFKWMHGSTQDSMNMFCSDEKHMVFKPTEFMV